MTYAYVGTAPAGASALPEKATVKYGAPVAVAEAATAPGYTFSGWSTGDVLARQVQDLRSQNAGGWALYRYGSLFGAGAPEQAAAECAALRAVTGKET